MGARTCHSCGKAVQDARAVPSTKALACTTVAAAYYAPFTCAQCPNSDVCCAKHKRAVLRLGEKAVQEQLHSARSTRSNTTHSNSTYILEALDRTTYPALPQPTKAPVKLQTSLRSGLKRPSVLCDITNTPKKEKHTHNSTPVSTPQAQETQQTAPEHRFRYMTSSELVSKARYLNDSLKEERSVAYQLRKRLTEEKQEHLANMQQSSKQQKELQQHFNNLQNQHAQQIRALEADLQKKEEECKQQRLKMQDIFAAEAIVQQHHQESWKTEIFHNLAKSILKGGVMRVNGVPFEFLASQIGNSGIQDLRRWRWPESVKQACAASLLQNSSHMALRTLRGAGGREVGSTDTQTASSYFNLPLPDIRTQMI